MPRPTIALTQGVRLYDAEDYAASKVSVVPLDGTVRAAQGFTDRVTTSRWWERNCPATWRGDEYQDELFYVIPRPPRRILVFESWRYPGASYVDELQKSPHGLWYPYMTLSRQEIHNGVPAIGDPWVILHELAHHMTPEALKHHGTEFIDAELRLVSRYLGYEHYRALKEGCRKVGLRLPGDLDY